MIPVVLYFYYNKSFNYNIIYSYKGMQKVF